MSDTRYDVLVVGGGNAGLCAALTARERGARVLVLERAPRALRGGNSRHTRNLRCAHAAPTDILVDVYRDDLQLVAVLVGDLCQHRLRQAAGRTPDGREVDQHRPV